MASNAREPNYGIDIAELFKKGASLYLALPLRSGVSPIPWISLSPK